MSRFKVGDRVRIIQPISALSDLITRSLNLVDYNYIKNKDFIVIAINQSRYGLHYLVQHEGFKGHLVDEFLELSEIVDSPLYKLMEENS